MSDVGGNRLRSGSSSSLSRVGLVLRAVSLQWSTLGIAAQPDG
jgi:hypothetical protein